jgi:hypothetical protein
MPQLWLVPADEPSYQQTLAQPRDLSPAPDKPDGFPDEARVWGVRTDPDHEQAPWDRNRRNLERMAPGDPLLIYRNSESHYVAAGRVGGPLWHTTWVRDEFWNGGPALDVFHIDDWQPINFEPASVNQTLGYEESFVPQGLWRVADDRPTGRLIKRIGLV